MLKESVKKLIKPQDLTFEESHGSVLELVKNASPEIAAAFLVLIRAKEETEEELLGIFKAMQECMVPFNVDFPVLDIVGTGGDGFDTINISTGSAILAAACGVKVAKQGNRSASSLCGSADVLEKLGITLEVPMEISYKTLNELGIAFLYAPYFHPALKNLSAIRKELGVRTTFNLIGPLLNPAKPSYQMIGVFDDKLLPKLAGMLHRIKTKHSLVFHGCGLDELSCVGPSNVFEVTSEGIKSFTLDPQKYGFSLCHVDDLRGGNAEVNAKILVNVFEGQKGPIADTLILNCGVALWLCGKVSEIGEGIALARENLQKGSAIKLLNQWRQILDQWRKLCTAI